MKLSINFKSLIFTPSCPSPCLINLKPCSIGVSNEVNKKLLIVYKSKLFIENKIEILFFTLLYLSSFTNIDFFPMVLYFLIKKLSIILIEIDFNFVK